MNHIQLSIEASEQDQEILIGLLTPLTATGFEQTETHLLAYFEEDGFESYEVHEVLKKFEYTINTVAAQNWNADWERSFQPVLVEQFCAIRAHFHEPIPQVTHEVIITPKMSFGTGHHATTFMMMQQMQHLDFKAKRVLDFGTGTGILAILAEKLGAAQLIAIDNDAWSFENAQENIQLNNCTKIKTILTETIPEGEPFDIILANITKNVLLDYMNLFKSMVVSGGALMLSGLLVADKTAMVEVCEKKGMKLVQEKERNGWVALLFAN